MLISSGANVNARDQAGWTALHEGAILGETKLVEYLIQKGADVNAKDLGGWTPRRRAWVKSNKDVIAVLERHGSEKSSRCTLLSFALFFVILAMVIFLLL